MDQESGHSGSSGSEQKDIVHSEADGADQDDDDMDPRMKKLAELGYDMSLLEAEP